MPRRSDSRERMIRAAATLFQRDGYAATGWRRVVVESGAPWGSQSHHFPDGKEQLGEEALNFAGSKYRDALVAFLDGRSPTQAIETWAHVSSRELERSGYASGCPIATVVLETAHSSPRLATAAHDALSSWRTAWADALRGSDPEASDVEDLAALIVASIEGALILARAANDPGPVEAVARALSALLAARSAPDSR